MYIETDVKIVSNQPPTNKKNSDHTVYHSTMMSFLDINCWSSISPWFVVATCSGKQTHSEGQCR